MSDNAEERFDPAPLLDDQAALDAFFAVAAHPKGGTEGIAEGWRIAVETVRTLRADGCSDDEIRAILMDAIREQGAPYGEAEHLLALRMIDQLLEQPR